MNTLDKKYQELLQDILDNGIRKEDRTETGTLSIFGRQIRHKMKDGFPLLTTKKMYWKGIVTELLWFLRGDTNIKYLVDNDCHIWDGDAYKNFERQCIPGTGKKMSKEEFINFIKTDDEFANKWGDLGPVYGKQWRNWDVPKILTIERGKIENSIGTEWGSWERNPIDQIQNLINDLKTNPDSRRLMVSAWNVAELDKMTLPPCHYGFQVYTRKLSFDERLELWYQKNQSGTGKRGIWEIDYIENYEGHKKLNSYNIPKRAISLMWNQRSVDVPLGLPFNLASYGLLLEILAKEVNMVPDELIVSLGDAHIYVNQIDGVKEQLTREPYPLPQLKLDDWYSTQGDVNNSTEVIMDCLMGLNHGHITLENYQSHPTIKMPLSN
jgi:thymidylate synthase